MLPAVACPVASNDPRIGNSLCDDVSDTGNQLIEQESASMLLLGPSWCLWAAAGPVCTQVGPDPTWDKPAQLLDGSPAKQGSCNCVCSLQDLNIRACGYDGGDCCSTTCRPSRLVQGACAPAQFNCRNKTAALDLLPPTIIAPTNFTRPVTWLNDSANANLPLEAAAYDNFPCFVSKINVSDVKLSDADCTRGVFHTIRRIYTATYKAGNVGRASAIVTILDDVPPRLAGVPQPAYVTWNSTFVRGGGMANATRVRAKLAAVSTGVTVPELRTAI